MTALHNQHRTTVAFHEETTAGTTPADAAAWATSAAGTDGFRLYVEELDPTFIRGFSAVPNADMQERVFEKQKPHKGLPTADGGSMVCRLWGSGHTYAAGTQVPATSMGRLLTHALGGGARGNDTAVAADGVTSQTVLDMVVATNLAIGQIIAIEDADDLGRLWPAQIVDKDGVEITLDRQMPFTVAVADKIYGTEMAWPDQAALTNPEDANFSTFSLLVQKGPVCWMAGGAHLGLTEVRVERGMQPKLAFEIHAARGYPPGAGAPSVPTFTDTVEGSADVQAIGRDTHCFLQAYGTATHAEVTLFSAAITPGVPILPQDTVTEELDGMPGRAGYRTEPADTVIEIVVALADAEQTRWTAGTLLTVSYFQVGPVGHCWCVHAPKVFLMEPPELVLECSNRYRLRLQATDDTSSTTEAGKAKVIFARY
jgi:hypothetical protein